MAEKAVKTDAQSIVPPKARTRPAPAPKTGTGRQGSSGGGFVTGFLTCFLLALLVIIGAAAAFWFNVGDFKILVVTTLRLSETEFLYLENRSELLAESEAELQAQQNSLTAEQQAIDKREKDVAVIEADLNTRASQLDELEASLSSQKGDLDKVIGIYEAMEPATAATILAVPEDLEENLIIFKNMNANKLALILAELTPDQAAQILALIAGN